jgi:hypothetical protein
VKVLPVAVLDRMEIARASCLAVDVASIAHNAGDASLDRSPGIAGQGPVGDVVAERNLVG